MYECMQVQTYIQMYARVHVCVFINTSKLTRQDHSGMRSYIHSIQQFELFPSFTACFFALNNITIYHGQPLKLGPIDIPHSIKAVEYAIVLYFFFNFALFVTIKIACFFFFSKQQCTCAFTRLASISQKQITRNRFSKP